MTSVYSSDSLSKKKSVFSKLNLGNIPENPNERAEAIYNILEKKMSNQIDINYGKITEILTKKMENRKFIHSFTLEIINDCESKPIINFSFNKTEEL